MGRGSIPAHAGEPRIRDFNHALISVYPRPRGGTCARNRTPGTLVGLSPPTRGNPRRPSQSRRRPRSIPAHAGEPRPSARFCARTAVYPRPRGGTGILPGDDSEAKGLSPPTRGNHRARPRSASAIRSIPAHAGEPPTDARLSGRFGVYPRPRGGTPRLRRSWLSQSGLSPPTRGNLSGTEASKKRLRSIPAHAGEPPPRPHQPTPGAVYPRPRGGTHDDGGDLPEREGLSPPTRGNPAAPLRLRQQARSIPAHAGEPTVWRCTTPREKVYPRPRGGTLRVRLAVAAVAGLSPPTRGNRPQKVADHPALGSIPAHAGEPAPPRAVWRTGEVYPRPRGGTCKYRVLPSLCRGLSPPTRGNLGESLR